MKRRHGTTLLSCMVATIIIAVAIPAVLQLVGTSTMANGEAARLTQAISLASNVLECGLLLPITNANGVFTRQTGEVPPNCSNLYGLNGCTFTPPIDSGGQTLPLMTGWEQRCTVTSFEVLIPDTPVAPTNTNARCLTVEVRYQGNVVYSASRIVTPTLGM